jgi:hypothetical protein
MTTREFTPCIGCGALLTQEEIFAEVSGSVGFAEGLSSDSGPTLAVSGGAPVLCEYCLIAQSSGSIDNDAVDDEQDFFGHYS